MEKKKINLIIVESPPKAGTIKNYLGSGYKVLASKGHVRDLPKSTLGIDVEDGFKAKYINIRGKGDLIKSLKKEAGNANKIYLATDPDREGEAISWHLATALGLSLEDANRVTFHEITKTAIKKAIKTPRKIDMNLVNSQQTRRILDRIVGYKLSPLLWKSVKSGLSAGRVQSVATKIIVEREEEIESFVPEEYWNITVDLQNSQQEKFSAKFFGNREGKIELKTFEETEQILENIKDVSYVVDSIKTGIKSRNPAPPFTTSTMQQEASRKLGFQSQRIMRVAQELYEGVNLGSEHGGVHGLITYMRTDSVRISEEAQMAAKEYIIKKFDDRYYPSSPRVYKTKKMAQDAHEAIRPVNIKYEPDKIKKHLTTDQYKLYKLIWDRFIASQMASATVETVNASISAKDYIFHASGHTVTFNGYMAVYMDFSDTESEQNKNKILPVLLQGEELRKIDVETKQNFTEPPSRYNEASLVKYLEEKGIGRPSTYATIITTIIGRGYVVREGKMLKPTEIGKITTELMKDYFPDIVDCEFTAQMEDSLDEIANGKDEMIAVLNQFYGDFSKDLENAENKIDKTDYELPVEQTDILCEKCGATMVVKNGRFGKFAACPNYPTCKNTKSLEEPKREEKELNEVKVDMKCELCGADMVIRSGRYGGFYACSNYPTCKNTKQITKEIDASCPKCGAKVVAKRGRNKSLFYSCSKYPECDFSSWDMPLQEKCPECGEVLYLKKGKNVKVCKKEGCSYKGEPYTEENKGE